MVSRRRLAARLGLFAAAFLPPLLLAEALLRVGPALPVQALSEPATTFDPLCEQDHWRMLRQTRLWTLYPPRGGDPDAVLGWLPSNLGAEGEWPTEPPGPDEGPRVLLLGDSFVQSTTAPGTRVADRLQAQVPDRRVRNLAVGGYGLDQTVLRLMDPRTVAEPGDVAVIGVLTSDLDRTIFGLRDAPKPRLLLAPDGPRWLPPDPDAGTEGFDTPSFLLSRLQRSARNAGARRDGLDHPECRVDEKRALADALLGLAAGHCTERGLDCTVLLLHRQEELSRPTWRAAAVHAAAGAAGLAVWDALDAQRDAERSGDAWQPDRHPSPAQNQALADFVAARL